MASTATTAFTRVMSAAFATLLMMSVLIIDATSGRRQSLVSY
jgi:hypothetical protein